MARLTKSIALAALACLLNCNIFAQTTAFQHSTPEAEGVSAAAIDSFLTAVGQSKNEFHSIMVLRHGKVIAEGWWNPYRADLRHSLYSCSKSFTSTAVGFAVSEKRLKLTDKVVSFFPQSLPDTVSPYLAQLTIKNLLTMSAGMEPDPTTVIPFTTTDWVKAFLATPIKHQPGSVFLYNTMATFMLSAIVQKVTGEKELDYLKPRLFDALGIHGEDWEASPTGINTGGWGLRLKTEDLAKMGQLYLQKGMWNGKQLLPAAWINEAITFKIDQAPGAPKSKKDSSDWMQGYCYQFWRCRHDAFRADGAFSQYIIVMPDQDAVIAITSETPDMQDELNLVWKFLLPAMHPAALPANNNGDALLAKHLAALALRPLPAALIGPRGEVPDRSFTLKPNTLNIASIKLTFRHDTCQMYLSVGSGFDKVNFGAARWQAGSTSWAGPSLLNGAKEDFSFLAPYKVAGSYIWSTPNTLLLKLRYIESPHSETITCHFNGDKLEATVEYSFAYGQNKIRLQSQ